jgi:hypothetical protein
MGVVFPSFVTENKISNNKFNGINKKLDSYRFNTMTNAGGLING